MVDLVRDQISKAGKKSYLFVIGKLNAAKVANFAEIGGWVVIGCWESSLVDSKDFYKPVITPFELQLVLKSDDTRVWTGEWSADFQKVLDNEDGQALSEAAPKGHPSSAADPSDAVSDQFQDPEIESEEESAPPEFDLRSGRYVSHARPMQISKSRLKSKTIGDSADSALGSTALAKRANGDVLAVNGVASPAAEFLNSKRTWKGLGSDFTIAYEGDEEGRQIEEGRSGIARGYDVGQDVKR